jgi:hypothetical protein
MLAGTIGSRPIGTPENARARQYIVDQLRFFGYDVRVQEIDAQRRELGSTAHVSNIIAVKAGPDRSALGLVSHYDSVPEAPGAGDDGSRRGGVARGGALLAARADRKHTLFVLVTDGEESGLMGARGLTADRTVMQQLAAYINVEATGAAGTGGAVRDRAGERMDRQAVGGRGAASARRVVRDRDLQAAAERHRLLGLQAARHPGLNFALVGDSYAYHTARDSADRLTDQALAVDRRKHGRHGDLALDAMDLYGAQRQDADLLRHRPHGRAVVGPLTAWLIAIVALGSGVLAWFKVLAASIRLVGLARWILDAVWSLVGVAAVAAAMIGGTWALRAARTVYHPWYAHPDRLFLMLLALGVLAGWSVIRIGALLPRRAHAPRHPVLVWSFTLPVWILLAGGMPPAPRPPLPVDAAAAGRRHRAAAGAGDERRGPRADLRRRARHRRRACAARRARAAALRRRADGATADLTPVWVYAALMLAAGAMVAPPFIAAVAATRPLLRQSILTGRPPARAVAVTAGLAYAAPAYTNAQPQRRQARLIVEPNAATATYEVGSQEPGLDLDQARPAGGIARPTSRRPAITVGRYPLPFVFRHDGPRAREPPATVSEFLPEANRRGEPS